ncbi:MAG: hypothetical protein H7A34_09130 [bacterium]|nr:hypothetical protein [bacterium]
MLFDEIQELSKKTHPRISQAITGFQKETAIVKTELEKLLIELIAEHMEVKVIYMSLFISGLPWMPHCVVYPWVSCQIVTI